MPVPTSISDLTNIAATNSPAGTESVKGTIDDYLRAHGAFIRQLADVVSGPTVTLASAASVAIGFAASGNIAITGTTTITSFDNAAEGTMRWVLFAGSLTLTHNATTLIMPGGANTITVAGDAALFKSLGGGNWKCMAYVRNSVLTPATGVLLSSANAVTVGQGGTGATTAAAALNNLGAMARADGIFTGNAFFAYGKSLFANDSGGTPRQLLGLGTDNRTTMSVAGGVSLNIFNQAYTQSLWSINNSGATSQLGSHTFENGQGVALKDNTGTARQLFSMGSDGGITHVNGAGAYTRWLGQGGSTLFLMFENGNVSAPGAFSAGTVTQTSDERKKKNWQRLTDAQLDALEALQDVGVFDWIDGSGASVGGPAQQIRTIVPQAVHEDDDGFLSVNYGGLCFAMAHGALRRARGAK